MGNLDGKVALTTRAARGQGRAHADGARLIAGGTRAKGDLARDSFVIPTISADVDASSGLASDDVVSIHSSLGLPAGAPFGGHKQSGYGRLGGRERIRQFTRSKNVHAPVDAPPSM